MFHTGATWSITVEERMEKPLYRGEFNANFVLLYFSSYSSIKM